tara:strand:+ start:80 stop:499 length:420 start_codon:yes stop_codon:yes gene_type:complete
LKYLLNIILGIIFGLGLLVSDFCNPQKIGKAANVLNEFWEPSIPLTLVSVAAVSGGLFLLLQKLEIYPDSLVYQRDTEKLNDKILAGAIFFGVGWGLSGFTPSTAVLNLSLAKWETVLFFIFMTGGLLLGRIISKTREN